MRHKLELIRKLVDEVLESFDDSDSVGGEDRPASTFSESSEFEYLKNLLCSEEWPEAVFPAQIADENSESDKKERAEGICAIMLPSLLGKKFLDFGCGEGHVAKSTSKEAMLSVGYDLVVREGSKSLLEEDEKFILTSDFARVQELGPYDVVLLYDVIDHCVSESQSEMLKKVASLLRDDGRIYMRCHPWCGRHGAHLYRKLNKAFVHLVLSEEELRSMGLESGGVIKTFAPLNDYNKSIELSGLKQESEPEIDIQEVEKFFKENDMVRERILKKWGISEWGGSPPDFQMSQCFVDYVLKKKSP